MRLRRRRGRKLRSMRGLKWNARSHTYPREKGCYLVFVALGENNPIT
jgi:hypothetical protein